MERGRGHGEKVLGDWRLRLVTVGLPAVLTGSFEFVRHSLLDLAGLPTDVGDLITAGLALIGGLIYFQTVSSLVAHLAAAAEEARTERLVFAQRQAIADELHDSLSQTFFFLNVRLKKIVERLRAAPAGSEGAGLAAEVSEVAGTTEEVYLQLRDTIRRLNGAGAQGAEDGAAAVTLHGLVAGALAGSGLQTVVDADRTTPVLDGRRWAAVQAILLEALRNVRKHARASRVRVWLREVPAGGEAGVEDDGRGFDRKVAAGFGFASMQRRAAAGGIRLTIESAPGKGTSVWLAWAAADPTVQLGEAERWRTTAS